MEPTPTADLDRTNDKVYDCTTSVVRAVMSLSQGKSSYLIETKCIIANLYYQIIVYIIHCHAKKENCKLQVFNRARLTSI